MPFFRRRPPADARPTAVPHLLADREVVPDGPPAASPRSLLRAGIPASDDRWLVGPALRRHQEAHGLTEHALAARLGVTVERLRWLQMRTRPNPDSPAFDAEVERLAASVGCDPAALRDLLAA